METKNYDDVLSWLRGHEALRSGARILIDGATGSGKSRLAMKLARDLGAARVSTDCYILSERAGPYVNRIALDYLRDDLLKYSSSLPFVIFEGICARDLLSKVGMNWDISLYVKKVATSGLWHFQYHLEDFLAGKAIPVNREEPFASDYEYHGRAKPQESAELT